MKMTLSTPRTISRNVSVTRASRPSPVRNASIVSSPAFAGDVQALEVRQAAIHENPRRDRRVSLQVCFSGAIYTRSVWLDLSRRRSRLTPLEEGEIDRVSHRLVPGVTRVQVIA